ncbi:MAG: hypothetical protein ABI977_01175, partial [Acidobacteriota bacterium]
TKMANNKNTKLSAMTFTREQEERFLNPAPGTAAARARDFGIDLTLTLACLRLTPQQRLERLEGLREFAREAGAAIKPQTGKPVENERA